MQMCTKQWRRTENKETKRDDKKEDAKTRRKTKATQKAANKAALEDLLARTLHLQKTEYAFLLLALILSCEFRSVLCCFVASNLNIHSCIETFSARVFVLFCCLFALLYLRSSICCSIKTKADNNRSYFH